MAVLMVQYTRGMPLFVLLAAPLVLFFGLGRWLTMLTCTIPVWPEDVEKDCAIEPNDPYLRDHDHLAAQGTVPKPEGAIGAKRYAVKSSKTARKPTTDARLNA
jgi:hypothetical protein